MAKIDVKFMKADKHAVKQMNDTVYKPKKTASKTSKTSGKKKG